MEQKKCEECEKEAMMFRDDGIGWCYEHAIEHAVEEEKKQIEEEQTGISQFDINNRAFEKKISLAQAKEELLKEKA